jgi:chromosome partitioning protein
LLISICSYKGGVAKSTTAAHLAGYLSDHGPTLLIDGDANRSCIRWAEGGKLPFKVVAVEELLGLEAFTHVVIDTAARPSDADMESLFRADLVIVPVTPDADAIASGLDTIELLRDLGARYRALITMVPPAPQTDGEECRMALQQLGVPLFEGWIREYKVYKNARLQGVLVRDLGERGRIAWRDYRRVGEELLGRI